MERRRRRVEVARQRERRGRRKIWERCERGRRCTEGSWGERRWRRRTGREVHVRCAATETELRGAWTSRETGDGWEVKLQGRAR